MSMKLDYVMAWHEEAEAKRYATKPRKYTVKLDAWQFTALQEAVERSEFLRCCDTKSVEGLKAALAKAAQS